MKFRYGLSWLFVFWLRETTANEGFKPIVRPSVTSTRSNISVGKSLAFDEEEILARDAGYYQYPLGPPPYLPPVYGLPDYPGPEGNVEIEFLFNELVIECIVDTPLEHIIWTKFPCPNQLYFGEGMPVADGAFVYDEDLYSVYIQGSNGRYYSRLTIQDPIGDESSGLYRCEAWPHFHNNGNGYGNGYQQYGTYPYYAAVESNVFIIGGDSLLENCYGNKQTYGSFGTKVNQGITNKKPSNNNMNKITKPKDNFKIRRNSTKSSVDRKDANAKYLRYNIKFDNNLISNKESRNVTLKEFLPSFKFPFQARHNDVMVPPIGPKSPQLVGNVTSSIRFDFFGNGNDKTWNSKYRRSNLQQGQGKNITVESLARKALFPRNQTETR